MSEPDVTTDAERATMRRGDKRPFSARTPLTLFPQKGEPFRWLPKQGSPYCAGEWLSQHIIRTLAYLPIYTALVVTLILVVQVFDIHIGGG